MALPPLPPLRAAFGSRPDVALSAIAELRKELRAELRSELEAFKASHTASLRHQTLQLLIGAVASCVAAIAGSRAVAPKPEPTQTVIYRGTTDKALDACRGQFEREEDRLTCIMRVVRQAAGLPKE